VTSFEDVVTLAPPAQGWIEGRAYGAEGRGLAKVKVTLRGLNPQTLDSIPEGMRDMWLAQVEAMGPEVMGHMISDLRFTTTDDEGRFQIEAPADPKQPHWLHLAHPDHVSVISKGFRKAITKPVEVTLVGGGTLEVEVFSPTGAPLPAAEVKISVATQEGQGPAVRSRTLSFAYDLSRLDRDALEAAIAAEVAIAEGVVAEEGAAAEGAAAEEAATSPAPAPTGPQVFKGVPPGSIQLHAKAPGFLAHDQPLQIAAGDRQRVTIRLGVGLTLRGRVQDPQGAPIAAAMVHGYAMKGRRMTQAQATSAEDGSFTLAGLDDADFNLSVAAAGFESNSGRRAYRPGGEPIVITLQRTHGISGRVVLSSGEPGGAGLQVKVRSLDARFGGASVASTAEDGTFQLQGLAQGRYRIVVQGAGLTTLDPVKVTIKDRGLTEVEIQVSRGSTATVVVTDAGQPVEGAKLALSPSVERMMLMAQGSQESGGLTDAKGHVELLGLAPGEHTFLVTKEGYAPAEVVVVVEAGRDPQPARASLVGGATLRCRVSQADGQPFDSKTIMIVAKGADFQTPEAFQTMATTDEEGRFESEGLSAGVYTLQVMNFGMGQGGGLRPLGEVRLQAAQTTQVELRLSRASASVRGVVIRGGKPKPGVQVSVYREGNMLAGFSQTVTDEAGRFSAKDLEAGTYVVSSDGARTTVTLRDDTPSEVRLEVKAGTVSGRLLNAAGQPARNAQLALLALDATSFEDAFRPQKETDELGSFQIENVRPGRYRLLATQPGVGATSGVEFTLLPEEAHTGVELQLGHGGGLELDLTRADGKPAAGAQLALFHLELGVFTQQLEGWYATATPTADRAGRVSLKHLIPGTYALLATSATHELGVLQGVSVAEGGTATGRIALALGGSLQVEAPPGSAVEVRLAGTKVPLGGTGSPMAQLFGLARTGPEGTLELKNLPPVELEVSGKTPAGRVLSAWRGRVVSGDAGVAALR
tara:strand:- start:241 stop:3183 length:2943 start_codon:yes stop_codon:yes gene_type:complete